MSPCQPAGLQETLYQLVLHNFKFVNSCFYSFFQFEEGEEGAEGDAASGVDANLLAGKLENTETRKDHESESEDEDDDEHLSEAEKLKKKAFRNKRKNHYNEFTNVQKAREMIAKELAELEDD